MAAAAEGLAVAALRSVLARVAGAAERAGRSADQVRVVAVSKTKPVSLLQEVYDGGHRHFGENYVQEIVEKAPQGKGWREGFAAQVPNLYMVETVDNPKIASNLDKAVANSGRAPLKVLVQVNTSGEESKYGVEPESCLELVRHVRNQCPNLEFSGLMTIGMLDYSSKPQNFQKLIDCREEISVDLGVPPNSLELSMGMSGDFEQAIEMGSTNVRIGSTIFGARDYSKK